MSEEIIYNFMSLQDARIAPKTRISALVKDLLAFFRPLTEESPLLSTLR